MNISNIHSAYFIGIGGIGMSAIARYFNSEGISVSGYDRVETALTRELVSEGMNIIYTDDAQLLPEQVDIVIYTPAIPEDNKVKNAWLSRGHHLYKRAEVLGLLTEDKKLVAVAGTHGKTTTSVILTHVLRESGLDCTGFLGGISVDFNGNFIHGLSEWVVAEADEYDRSFLQLHPQIAIITSLDPDHLDIYGDEEEMKRNYLQFLSQVKRGGWVIMHKDVFNQLSNEEIARIQHGTELLIYGENMAKCGFTGLKYESGRVQFSWMDNNGDESNVQLGMPGKHNVSNAVAALTIGHLLEVDKKLMMDGLANFKGIRRRFETRYKDAQRVVIDDYAHHPSELSAAIRACRDLYPGRKITGVFQPHLYTRTKDFYRGFASALDELDEIYILDIYPARELPIEGVTANLIAREMNNKKVLCTNMQRITEEININELDVLLVLGAGNIVDVIPDFIQKIKKIVE